MTVVAIIASLVGIANSFGETFNWILGGISGFVLVASLSWACYVVNLISSPARNQVDYNDPCIM